MNSLTAGCCRRAKILRLPQNLWEQTSRSKPAGANQQE
ncbi:hypothetical protein AK973_3875 [Pseudomonas brassicacearum]|nr:hypothetical protein AK973_3875 [Pseudomonas brassicacearum]